MSRFKRRKRSGIASKKRVIEYAETCKENGKVLAQTLAAILLDFDGVFVLKQENWHLASDSRIQRVPLEDGNLKLVVTDSEGKPYNGVELKRWEHAQGYAEPAPTGAEGAPSGAEPASESAPERDIPLPGCEESDRADSATSEAGGDPGASPQGAQ